MWKLFHKTCPQLRILNRDVQVLCPRQPDERMAACGKMPLRFALGERWLYNVASDILGVLVALMALTDWPAHRRIW